MSATCFAAGLIIAFAAFAASWPVQSRSRSFWGVASGRCDLPCGTTCDYICCFSCFFASARRVALPFLGHLEKVRPALRKAGRALGDLLLEKLRPALRLRGSNKCQKMKVPRMKFSILENAPTPRESIFKLCTASHRPYMAKSKKY